MLLYCKCRVYVDTGLKFGLSRRCNPTGELCHLAELSHKLRCSVRCELSYGCNSSCELGHTRKNEWSFSVVHELSHARGIELSRSVVFELSLVSAEALSDVEIHRAHLGGLG